MASMETQPKCSKSSAGEGWENRASFLDKKYDSGHKIALSMPPFCKPRATDAVLLLLRMELVQSVTQCEAAAVFAHPIASLLLSHCINSREPTPRACERHTPLGLLQDPDTARIHEAKGNTQLGENTRHVHWPFLYWLRMCLYCCLYAIKAQYSNHCEC